MPVFERDDVCINYEIHGDGIPVLLLAPGGMRSSISIWEEVPYNAIERLASSYKVIAMDQRNAGRSTAPIKNTDGWEVYTRDQIALMDHLGIEKFHVAGMCIGGPFIMGLARAIPERVMSAVMLQTIGFDDNRETFFELFDSWAEKIKHLHPTMDEVDWVQFRSTMFGGTFLFNVSEDFVAACQTPFLVLMGEDVYHPEVTSRKVAELAPNATFIESWQGPDVIDIASKKIDSFLASHS